MAGYLDHPGPLALAHQGFSLEGHTNTMAAFAAAVDLGYQYIETDVHATRDGVLVTFHDSTLDPTTDRSGAIADLEWREVKQAKVGGVEPVATLEELLGTWPDVKVNIDIKAESAIGPFVDIIERTRSHDRICVASFSDRRRTAVLRRLSSPVATSAGKGTMVKIRLSSALRLSGVMRRQLATVSCLQIPTEHAGIPVVTPHMLAQAHRAGCPVHVWTINDPDEMRRLLDLGVDGIVTDRADLLRDVLIERGVWAAG